MDKPDVFMPLYIGDYLAGTSRLTTELHGAYLLLIMDYWMNGPLPDDDALLASIAKMTPDAWSNARATLEKYFSIADGSWKQKRIEEELAAATEKKRKAREKAKKAAAARWDDAPSNAPSNASAELKECPSPSPSPSENNKPPIVPQGDRVPYEEIFDLYHELLPELPPAPNQTEKRKKNIAQRWKETAKVPAKGGFQEFPCNDLGFWERFFGRVRNSPHLMGENERGWQANLEWITKKENFYKIIEGNYVK